MVCVFIGAVSTGGTGLCSAMLSAVVALPGTVAKAVIGIGAGNGGAAGGAVRINGVLGAAVLSVGRGC